MQKPTREEALSAIKTILRFIGENPERDGLKDTPNRIIESYEEFFEGYGEDPASVLQKEFVLPKEYVDYILVKNIEFVSFCEHHMLPIMGKAHIAYIPKKNVLGLSKLPRLVDIFAKRLQTQESMTTDIGELIDSSLSPQAVAVMIEAEHYCMSIRGVKKRESLTRTYYFSGKFKTDEKLQNRFMLEMKS